MELYSFEDQTLEECEFISDRYYINTVYNVKSDNFDAVLRYDRSDRFISPQDWVFDELAAKHPGLCDHWITVHCSSGKIDEFVDHEYYEIVVTREI